MPVSLTQKIVNRAVAAGEKAEISDARARGLVLRIHGPTRWSWEIRRAFRGKDHRFKLGDEWSLDEARELHVQFDLFCRRGVDDRPNVEGSEWYAFLARRKSMKLGVEIAPTPPKPRPVYVPPEDLPPSMRWSEAVEIWLTELRRIRRDSTAYGYGRALAVAELQRFREHHVASISRESMAEAIAAISARGKERQAETTCVAIRGLFRFLGNDAMRSKTGVADGVMEKLSAPERSLDESDDGANHLRIPGADDLARIMKFLTDGDAPERDRLAGQLLVYSVQRRRAVALARVSEFEAAGEFGGLWKIPALHRKTASVRARRGLDVGAHVVPLPPAAWAVVQKARKLGAGSEYLFPAERARRSGSPVTSMPPESITHFFGGIPANDVSPHDIRRAFGTTYASAARLKTSDIKLILDHSEGVASGDVTATHYAFLTGTHEKWPIMTGWCDFVNAAMKRGVV